MRIGLISQEYPSETAHGGIGSQTYLKAHDLTLLGHDVYVISHSTDQAMHEYQDGLVRVIRIPSFDERLPIYTEAARWITYSAEVAATVSELHVRVQLDLIDFPEWGGEGYIYLLNRTEWNHIPTVIQLHGPMVMLAHTIGWPEVDSEFYRIGTEMEETCLRLSDAVFSSSKCSAEWCVKYYGHKCKNIPIIHTGVDTGLFRPINISKEKRPTIIFVGKIEQNKGVENLFEASCRIEGTYPDLQLRLLGRGNSDLMEKLRKKAQIFGRSDLIDLPGFVEQQELPAHFSRAHVFAAPSLYEGGPGFVYLEAMACGLPVIACEGSGAAEVVIHGENGFLVPAGDVDALESALRFLLSDPDRLAMMGAKARQYVLAEADSRVCIKKIEAFYQTVVSGRNDFSKIK